MSGTSIQLSSFSGDEYCDSTSIEGLIDPETKRQSKHCRKYAAISILVMLPCAIIIFSALMLPKFKANGNGNVSTATSNKNIGNNEISSIHRMI